MNRNSSGKGASACHHGSWYIGTLELDPEYMGPRTPKMYTPSHPLNLRTCTSLNKHGYITLLLPARENGDNPIGSCCALLISCVVHEEVPLPGVGPPSALGPISDDRCFRKWRFIEYLGRSRS